MKTIVLRFSEAEREGSSSTVTAHNEIIERSEEKACWWGWWKKNHEAFRADLLDFVRELAESSGLRIGLVNRKGEEGFYFAECIGCAHGLEASILSPNPALTPDYYSSQPFPAWFKLSRIVQVDRDQFLREFGNLPTLDATLYEIIGEDDRKRIIPSPNWNLEVVGAPGDAILHISDIHFGEGHGFPTVRAQQGSGIDIWPLVDTLSEAVQNQIPTRIGTVVVSGDFISKGNGNDYPLASGFLDDLLRRLGLQRKNCVVVPGNHDLWTASTEHPTRTYEHEAPYRQFVEGFHREEVHDLERTSRISTPSGCQLVFVALNSARIRADALKEYGYVSRHRYDSMLAHVRRTLLHTPASGNLLLFVVLHHHIMPAIPVDSPDGKRPVSLTLDAGELIEELCKWGVGYVLHGHQHMPFIGFASKVSSQAYKWADHSPGLFILGCGSTGAKRDGCRIPSERIRSLSMFLARTHWMLPYSSFFLRFAQPSIGRDLFRFEVSTIW